MTHTLAITVVWLFGLSLAAFLLWMFLTDAASRIIIVVVAFCLIFIWALSVLQTEERAKALHLNGGDPYVHIQ